ncbi:IclR family transcriptional regulator [Streptomyces sp. NRRL F-5630]|uniref:IclR family transcriptional regulator n=1 Tax=Streptomyces sp. NRRL F-5630 TaxID=1463864 RepID=UPI0004CC5295|nr:IclR family transcriptional regulator [Streptomyces sp. NRRL F-5630]
MTAREADAGREGVPARRADGAQTLERGLGVLRMLAEAPHGLRASEVAAALGVHRSIAYRLLTALTRSHFAARDAAGRYRVGVAFYTLAQRARPPLVDLAMPVLRDLAVELGATACLVVPDGAHAVAVAVVEPPGPGPRFSYGVGNRDPLDRGSAGLALLSAGEPLPGEPLRVAEVRARGWAITHEEVTPGTIGVAAPVRVPEPADPAAINVITHRRSVAERAVPLVVAAARRMEEVLAGEDGDGTVG